MSNQNHLAESTSPYLLQHADNPVDWYPWGEEALQRARNENKPIFLSIGYSACHWCHVMEHESFEDEQVAALMNKNFVCIKVDREERPDLDDIYMTFVQLSTGSGGWPMSVFLTPDLKPFFGGTYFPPEDRYGRPGFTNVLRSIAAAWEAEREQIEQSSEAFADRLSQVLGESPPVGEFPRGVLDKAAQQLLAGFDAVNGGFSGPPKFPPSYSLSLLMRHIKKSGDAQALRALTFTLDKMAEGGIYDQLGGGFHRYAVDTYWLVPHFEKMLYDNALLSWTYFEAYQLTGSNLYLHIGTEVLDYVLRDLSDEAGGFHSAEDADSDGEEGKFYVWTPEEVVEILGETDGRIFCDYFDVSSGGNFEAGKSILHVRGKPDLFAERYSLAPMVLSRLLAKSKEKLLEVRSSRVRPLKDDKVLADWNGLMLSSLAKGFQITGDQRYLEAANRCAEFLEQTMYSSAGLRRTFRQGKVAQHGFLSDYAFVCNGLLDLYEAGFNIDHLKFADQLALEMIAKFAAAPGGFYQTLADQNDLLVRKMESYDGAIPSGNSVAALALSRLALLTGKDQYRQRATQTFAAFARAVESSPRGYHYLINAHAFATSGADEIALVGATTDSDMAALVRQIHSRFRPNKVLAQADPTADNFAEIQQRVPLLAERQRLEGSATAYVCHNFACKLPVSDPDALESQLQ